MGRAAVWTVAGAALLAAVVLTLLGLGDNAAALPNWQALILGLVQGATELLPISSSGHLILVPWLADWEYLKEHDAFNQTFDVSLHLGTLVAVVLYFREDIVRLAAAWLGSIRRRRIETVDERIAWCVVAATVPAAIVGAVGENLIAETARRAVADRDPARRSSGSCCTSPTGGRRRRGWGTSASGPRSPSASRSRSP